VANFGTPKKPGTLAGDFLVGHATFGGFFDVLRLHIMAAC
jgi:hypothetical protein